MNAYNALCVANPHPLTCLSLCPAAVGWLALFREVSSPGSTTLGYVCSCLSLCSSFPSIELGSCWIHSQTSLSKARPIMFPEKAAFSIHNLSRLRVGWKGFPKRQPPSARNCPTLDCKSLSHWVGKSRKGLQSVVFRLLSAGLIFFHNTYCGQRGTADTKHGSTSESSPPHRIIPHLVGWPLHLFTSTFFVAPAQLEAFCFSTDQFR